MYGDEETTNEPSPFWNDDPLYGYDPGLNPVAANVTPTAVNAAPAAPASVNPPAVPADPAATPRVAPVPAADPDAFTKTATDLKVTVVGSAVTARWTQPGSYFNAPGVDLTLEHTFTAFDDDANEVDALTQRALLEAAVESLAAQAYAISAANIAKLRKELADRPTGVASVHPVNPQPEAVVPGTQTGTTVPATPTAEVVVKVANGAEAEDRWGYNPGYQGQGQFPWVKPSVYPTAQLSADALAKVAEMGINPKWLTVFDERPGTRTGKGAAESMGSAANVKWTAECKQRLTANGFGHLTKLACARVAFNDDESLYVYLGKNKDPKLSIDAQWELSSEFRALLA